MYSLKIRMLSGAIQPGIIYSTYRYVRYVKKHTNLYIKFKQIVNTVGRQAIGLLHFCSKSGNI